MTIESALQDQGWTPETANEWIAIKDQRPEFRKAFRTNRVGKIIGSKFYVTIHDLSAAAERLICSAGFKVEYVASTSGRGTPGCSTSTHSSAQARRIRFRNVIPHISLLTSDLPRR